MKKFTWRLQRLLDVRQKQEDALRAELIGLVEQSAALRGRILMEKAMLRSRLSELRQTASESRLRRQQDFMACVSVVDARIASLQSDLNKLEQKRKEKTEAIMAVRKFRKSLERLKAQALNDYDRALNSEEQKNQDERSNAAFARKVIEII
jgi:flagellar export protein FliJ